MAVSLTGLELERVKGSSLNSDVVKVLIGRDSKVVIGSEGGFQICRVVDSTPISTQIITNLTFSIVDFKKPIYLKPVKGHLLLNGRPYHGNFIIYPQKKRLLVINRVLIDDYLKGVLPHEISPRWPMNAIKAQAIASRSYAFVKRLENRGKLYDLNSTVSSQVYKGMVGEDTNTNWAVDETSGFVMSYKGKIAVAFFHSSCGGYTEDSGNVWSKTLPYLRGVKSPWCRSTKHYSWSVQISEMVFRKRLAIKSVINKVSVVSRYPSGRVKKVALKMATGKFRFFSGKQLRRIIGNNKLKGTNFKISLKNGFIKIDGKGWGHGVGMCQWCAKVMADKGFTAFEILKYFYRGVTIKRRRVSVKW